MSERWIKEAEDLKSNGQSGEMDRNHSGVKVTWHVTVSPSGGTWFDAMHRVLTNKRAEPHVLYDPLTDRLGQYFPLDRSGRALANDGNQPTNRDGTINIQIEVVAMPDGFTDYWTPGPNYKALMRAIRSWGIPDEWPGGRLAPSGRADQQVSRSWSNYRKSGHFGHCQVPGNSHWDPGPIDQRAIFTATQGRGGGAQSVDFEVPAVQPEPQERYWTPTAKGYSTADVQRIVDVAVDNLYGPATKAAVRDLQKELGVTADGYFGPTTAAAFEARKPAKVKAPAFPLPSGSYFGPKSGPGASVSGYYSHRNDLRTWQRQMKRRGWTITTDGLYGKQSASVARAFQKEKGLSVDSLIGPATWKAAWTEPVT